MAEELTLQEEAELEEEIKADEMRRATALFSAEAIIIFPIAALLDFIGLLEIIPAIGNALSYIPDIIGVLTIGLWTFIHSRTVKVTYRAAARATQAAKWAKRLRWLRPLLIIGEFIPIVGIAPLWILVVYFELKS